MTAVLVIVGIEVVLVAAALIMAAGHLRRACLFLIALTAPLELYRAPALGYNLSLFRLSVALSLVLLLATDMRGIRTAVRNPVVTGYAALAMLMLVSLLLFSENDFLAKRIVAQVSIGTVTVGVIYVLARGERWEGIAAYLLVGAALPFLAGCYQSVAPWAGLSPRLPLLDLLPVTPGLERARLDTVFAGGLGIRLKGTFGDPNHFGTYAATICAIAGAVGVSASRQRRVDVVVGAGGVAVAALAMVVASYSRTAWLAMIGGTVALVMLALARRRSGGLVKPRVAHWAAACLVLALLMIPLAQRVADRFDPDAGVNRTSNKVHVRTARVAIDRAVDHPITGIGLGDLGAELGQPRRVSGAHSTYLVVGAELGVLGLIAIAGLATMVLLGLLRATMMEHDESIVVASGFAAAYSGFLAAGLVYDLWWDDFHWVMIGLSVAAAGAVVPWGRPWRGGKRKICSAAAPTASGAHGGGLTRGGESVL